MDLRKHVAEGPYDLILAGLVLMTSGCTVDVGPCDPFAARDIVYLNAGMMDSPNDGTPMFAGQALMQTTILGLQQLGDLAQLLGIGDLVQAQHAH